MQTSGHVTRVVKRLFPAFVTLALFSGACIPAVFSPCGRLHVKEGCICSSWKTSVGRRQQTLRAAHTLPGPFFSEKATRQGELSRTLWLDGRVLPWWCSGPLAAWWYHDSHEGPAPPHQRGNRRATRTRSVSLRAFLLARHCSTWVLPTAWPSCVQRESLSLEVWWTVRCFSCRLMFQPLYGPLGGMPPCRRIPKESQDKGPLSSLSPFWAKYLGERDTVQLGTK